MLFIYLLGWLIFWQIKRLNSIYIIKDYCQQDLIKKLIGKNWLSIEVKKTNLICEAENRITLRTYIVFFQNTAYSLLRWGYPILFYIKYLFPFLVPNISNFINNSISHLVSWQSNHRWHSLTPKNTKISHNNI